MGSIEDAQVEWAVVHRLNAMLQTPPKTEFSVTQSFALFNAIVLWTKQRMWVGGEEDRAPWFNSADHAARDVREALRATDVFEQPWQLSRRRPEFVGADWPQTSALQDVEINSDFNGMSVEQFVKWLRNALAHGDGRSIRPVHKPSRRTAKSWLAGFEIWAPASKRSQRTLVLTLYHSDIRRIGNILAEEFCLALSRGDQYFEGSAESGVIEEAA